MPFSTAVAHTLALDTASVVTAAGGVAVALIAGAVALWQTGRTRALEREKIRLQLSADLRRREQEWDHERQAGERAARRAAEEAEQERERAAARQVAHRSGLAAAAAAYCARLVGELSTLRILDMSRPLRLDRLYVQVRVQEQQPLRFVREEEFAQDRTRDTARREAQAAEGTSGAAHTYAPVDALQHYQRIVVVGDPGAGKTTMLRHLALRMASRAEGEALPGLPAYVELSRYVESGHELILDYVAAHWADQYGFADAGDHLVERLTDGTAALLFDGLDEVLGGESAETAAGAYNRVTEEITRLAARYPRALIATTCRRHGWRGGLPQFQVLEALDFEWPQIETFIANWFGDRDRRRGGLVRALSGNARLQTLAANPLLLSLVAIVYEQDLELPERRAALYRRCVEVLLREWDAHRNISRYSRFTTDRKQDLLKQIAWQYHQRGQRYFREEELLDLIADFLPTIDLPRTDNRAILDEIAAQYGLLKAQAHGWYGFLHLTLQEHFAAAALLERGPAGIEQAVRARHDPWWEEVILLLAGSLADATGLLLGILQTRPGAPRTRDDAGDLLHLPDDDLFHTDLLLAARCLTGSPRVADVLLRRQIIRTVWELLETSPYDRERQRAAEAIVGVLGSEAQLNEVIARIGDGTRGAPARAALVEALTAHGGRNVGERLLGVLTLRPEMPESLRGAIVTALGTLHVEAAVPFLLGELADVVDRPDSRFSSADRVIRALGGAGGPMDAILRAMGVEGESDAGILNAGCEALTELRDPRAREPLLELLLRDNGWFFERARLAETYLNLGGDQGGRVLLDAVRSDRASDFQSVPLMAALAEFCGKGHGWALRDVLLAVAADERTAWQLRWLALECLDHLPGDIADLEAPLGSGDARVAVGAAATSAAWGTPQRLDAVRSLIMDGTLSASLVFRRNSSSWSWTGRIATRLGRLLSPYGGIDVTEAFFASGSIRGDSSVVLSGEESEEARQWLYAFAPEAGVDAYLAAAGSVPAFFRGHLPPRVPASRVHAVLQYLTQRSDGRSFENESLLRLVASVADEASVIPRLLSLTDRAEGEPTYARDDFKRAAAHDAAFTVSRRAPVRVLRDRTVVPLN
ncbi:NACHT domain-containing protein [Streptomyces sp. NPDC048297]|uniref:NACHT domain-containing protein n=1 Tax=Streptomyces sp. NPDC048297 TaxID=3365531 RepID=UPI00371A05BA